MGHENIGTIAKAGREFTRRKGFKEGDLVFVEHYVACGKCEWCHLGQYRHCENTDWRDNPDAIRYGYTSAEKAPHLWGGFAQYVYLPWNAVVHRVPKGVTPELAGLVTPMANGVEWSLFDGGVGYNSTVLIQGPGQQGLSQTVICKQAGAALIIVTGTSKDGARLEVAKTLGADFVIDVAAREPARARHGDHRRPRASMSRSTAPRARARSRSCLGVEALKRKGGVIVVQGEMAEFPNFPLAKVTVKYITIKSARGHSYRACELALAAARLEALSAREGDDAPLRAEGRGPRHPLGRRQGRQGRDPRVALAVGMNERIPVTVLTGHLGAGKTTLLNRILTQDHGRRYAVIVNEFGAIGIDNDLIVHGDEELFEMNNGCVCCTVRGDLVRIAHGLLARPGGFDAIVVETSGLADPGPVAQTFFLDQFLQTRTALDSVTTVVDAKHILLRLGDSPEAREQIAFADQIVLNKTELVTGEALCAIEARLRAINALAPIHRAVRADVALDTVLGRGGFDLDRIVALDPDFLDPAHAHEHDGDIRSVALACRAPLDGDRVRKWLAALVAGRGPDILRGKGILDVAGETRRLVFQSVHMLHECEPQRPWHSGEERSSRLVLIGRDLDEAALQASFASCAAAG